MRNKFLPAVRLFLIALLLFCCSSSTTSANAQSKTAIAHLTLQGPDGAPAFGVVCDNLAGVDYAQSSYLTVEMPEFSKIESTKLTNADGPQADNDGQNNIGRIEVAGQELRYFPPQEFNEKQNVGNDGPVTQQRERIVLLTVRGKDRNGADLMGRVAIRLARPTVVLVHGINSSPATWIHGGQGLQPALESRGFDVVALDYGASAQARALQSDKDDLCNELYFKSNGPVEFVAGLLDEKIKQALATRRKAGFVTHRVDVVAHSYGGIVARWYLQSDEKQNAGNSRLWYVNSSLPGGANLYHLPDKFIDGGCGVGMSTQSSPEPHSQTVRKLVTLAAPWRGVPIVNFVNEVFGPVSKGEVALRRAQIGLKRLGWYVNKTLPVPMRVPSLEVGAVNSPWLQRLNKKPFEDGVAYAAIAGGDNSFIKGYDLYTELNRYLPAHWFPYFKLESRSNAKPNYSDGLIPVWSAVISPSTPVVRASHGGILTSREVKLRVEEYLSTADLKRGANLNTLWDGDWQFELPVESPHGASQKVWNFHTGKMAPSGLDAVYQQRLEPGKTYGVARLSQESLREIRAANIETKPDGTARIAWSTLLPTTHALVRISSAHRENRAHLTAEVTTPNGKGASTQHVVTISGLKPDARYSIRVESEIENAPDAPIHLMSRWQVFRVPAAQ